MHAPSHPKEPPPSDQTLLVLLAQTGDRAALEQLLRNSHAPLRRYIIGLAGVDLVDDRPVTLDTTVVRGTEKLAGNRADHRIILLGCRGQHDLVR